MKINDAKIANAMRKLWRMSDERATALKRSKVKGVAKGHICEWCRKMTVKPEVDHCRPVGSTPGSRNAKDGTNWDSWMARLFVPPSQLQVLCRECHQIKTAEDRKNGFD